MFRDFAKAITDGDRSYFLGTIVTIPRSPETLEVIDGQQRLATTAIFLAQIRNHLVGSEPLIAESITNDFLTVIDREKRARVTKLQLNLDDNEFFRAAITESPPKGEVHRASHARIQDAFREAARQIKTVVGAYDPKDHGDVLNQWLQFIEHGAQVILLMVPSDINAYKMFETLNDRGLKTSQSDLVKNYLFGQSDRRLAEAQQKWALLRGTLETLDEDDITVTFLRHALISMGGYLREPEVYEVVQRRAKGEQQTIALLSSLEALAINYVAIFNPEHEKWNTYPDAMRRAIQILNLFNIRPFRPLMLAVASRFAETDGARAFEVFVAWGVRLLIASSTRSGSVEHPLADAAKLVSDGEITTTKDLQGRLSTMIPNDQKFARAFEVATVSKASLARYYLRALERTAKGESEPYFLPTNDRETINLEHVLPRNPDLGSWDAFSEEAAQLNTRRLGNLALLLAKKNTNLGSESFDIKRAVYAASPYVLTSQIATVDDWNEDAIANRQEHLAQLALGTWPL